MKAKLVKKRPGAKVVGKGKLVKKAPRKSYRARKKLV